MLEMCSGTSKYPWVTIWDIGITYLCHFLEISKKKSKKGSFSELNVTMRWVKIFESYIYIYIYIYDSNILTHLIVTFSSENDPFFDFFFDISRKWQRYVIPMSHIVTQGYFDVPEHISNIILIFYPLLRPQIALWSHEELQNDLF